MPSDRLRRGLLTRLLRKLPYDWRMISGIAYKPSDSAFEKYIAGGIHDYVKAQPQRMKGVVGLWIAHSKALEDIQDRDGITVVLEDDFVCQPDFFECALRMLDDFDRSFDVIMFDCQGSGPIEPHRIAPNIYQSDGLSYPAYWGSHCLFVNNASIPKILAAKTNTMVKDLDGFHLQRDTGLDVYLFYTGKCRQLFFGSHAATGWHLLEITTNLIKWLAWTQGSFKRAKQQVPFDDRS